MVSPNTVAQLIVVEWKQTFKRLEGLKFQLWSAMPPSGAQTYLFQDCRRNSLEAYARMIKKCIKYIKKLKKKLEMHKHPHKDVNTEADGI